MKYIEPPTKRRQQKVGPIPKKKPHDSFIRSVFIAGAILILIILSEYIR
jgi:hypothetical protein